VTVAVANLLTFVDSNDRTGAGSREDPRVRTLVEAARQGDREAFGELIALHERVAFRTALAVLGAREDAEDAAQEALLTAWQKLSGFRGESTFRTWLLTIVWRKALDRRRVRRLWWMRTASHRLAAPEDPLDALVGRDPDPEAHAVSRDLARRIQVAIGTLAPKLKCTFLLATSGEHTYDEIAQLQKIPAGTVKWRVAEARRVIAKRVKNSPREESESPSAAARASGGGAPRAGK